MASGVDEDSVELITDGEVEVCFDGWYKDRQVEAAEHRVGGLSQALLDIVYVAAWATIEEFPSFVVNPRTLFS